MRILMVTAEMAPLAKVGGLGDVADSLSRALTVRGHDVRVVLPLYGQLDRKKEDIRPLKKLPTLQARVGQRVVDFRIHTWGAPTAKPRIYLIECEELYGRKGIYLDSHGKPWADALDRASLHAQATLMLPALLDWPVDIVHCHDAEAVPALLYRRHWYAGRTLPGPAAGVLTIHNLAHQEIHDTGAIDLLGLPRSMGVYPGLLEFHGLLNLMKAGILTADRLNTVSPTYAAETLSGAEFGMGLEGVLGARGDDYSGILNGGDYGIWDPAKDAALPAKFSPGKMAGKAKCRGGLLKQLGLRTEKGRPLCGFVGRLAGQKGMDLLLPLLDRLAGDGFAFAILGSGERRLHEALEAAAARHPQRVAFSGKFDEKLAHRIYAGSDVFLMPSLFEPCGLSQMYALKYGTPPVVRATGGLADTVVDVGSDPDASRGNGFVFAGAKPSDLMAALRRAEAMLSDADAWARLQACGMEATFSWDTAAEGYEAMYAEALETHGGAGT